MVAFTTVCWTFASRKSCDLTGGLSLPHSSWFTRGTFNFSQLPGRTYSSSFSLSFASLSLPANLLLIIFARCSFMFGPVYLPCCIPLQSLSGACHSSRHLVRLPQGWRELHRDQSRPMRHLNQTKLF